MRDDHERVIDIIEAIERIEKITSKGKRVFYDDEMVQVSSNPPPPDNW